MEKKGKTVERGDCMLRLIDSAFEDQHAFPLPAGEQLKRRLLSDVLARPAVDLHSWHRVHRLKECFLFPAPHTHASPSLITPKLRSSNRRSRRMRIAPQIPALVRDDDLHASLHASHQLLQDPLMRGEVVQQVRAEYYVDTTCELAAIFVPESVVCLLA